MTTNSSIHTHCAGQPVVVGCEGVLVCVGDDRIQRGAGHVATLLGEQVDDVKLFEGDEGGHHRRRSDDGADSGDGDGPRPHPEPRAVQGGALIEAAIHALERPVDGGDHKRQGHPQVQRHTRQEGDPVDGQEVHLAQAQHGKELIEDAELGIEHPHPPQQDGDIGGHRPGYHEQGLIDPLQPQPGRVQPQGDEEPQPDLDGHIQHGPDQGGAQSGQEPGIELEQCPGIVVKSDEPIVRPVVQVHIGQGDVAGIGDGKDDDDDDQQQSRDTVEPGFPSQFLSHKHHL